MTVVQFPGPPRMMSVTTQHSGSGGGGGMDDLIKRLGNVESAVSDVRSQVSGLSASMPHLATKSDLNKLESSLIKWLIATIIAGMAVAFTIARFAGGHS